MESSNMSDKKPYFLRAIYDWICDNECTAYLLLSEPAEDWVSGVPSEFCSDKTLVLNISPTACRNLEIANEYISFEARFNGVSHSIYVDMRAVVAIFAKENSEGISFEVEEYKKIKDKSEEKSTKNKQINDNPFRVVK